MGLGFARVRDLVGRTVRNQDLEHLVVVVV